MIEIGRKQVQYMAFTWVILGAGDIACKFADAVRRIDDAEVIGVGSRSAERGAAFAQKHGIPHAGSYEAMLALRPDAAYIAATTDAIGTPRIPITVTRRTT